MLKLLHRMFARPGFLLCAVLLLASGMIFGQERRASILKGGVQEQDEGSRLNKLIEESCLVWREALDLYHKAAANPELVASDQWRELHSKLDIQGCECPFVDVRFYIELLSKMEIARPNPRARTELLRRMQSVLLNKQVRDPSSLQAFDQAIQRDKERIQEHLESAEKCFESHCSVLQVLMEHYDLTLGVVCWVDGNSLPILKGSDVIGAGLEWWPNKVMIGLVATTNKHPPFYLTNDTELEIFRNSKDYRTLLWCKLGVDIDRQTDRVVSCQIKSKTIDPGWTPPTDRRKFELRVGYVFPKEFDDDGKYHPAEYSPISGFYIQQKHPNSALGPIPANEQLLVDGLIKFRAGQHTDWIGIDIALSPYHVPWTWSEMALTYIGKGQFYVYGRGGIFPTHSWYFNGHHEKNIYQKELQISDKDVTLTTGEIASRPQPKDPPQIKGEVYLHKHTLPPLEQIKFPRRASPANPNIVDH